MVQLTIAASGATDRGQVRSGNEDAYCIDSDLGIFAVADGLGGHAAGEVASRETLAVFRREISKNKHILDDVVRGLDGHNELLRLARDAAQAACSAVHDRARSDLQLSGMGSTLTALVIAGTRGVMVHAGDSRLYLHRDGATEQLSTDHTMAWEMWRSGEITWTEANEGRFSHVLTRAIGAQPQVSLESLRLEVLPDDVFLLCSDGLVRHLESTGELTRYLAGSSTAAAPQQLLDLANGRGGKDNITVVAVGCAADESDGDPAATETLRGELAALRNVPALAGIRYANLQRLRNAATESKFSAGDEILAPGQQLDGLYLLVEGQLQVSKRDVTLKPGSAFGATSLLGPRSSRAHVAATKPGRLMIVARDSFHALAQRRPWFGVDVLRQLSGELCAATEGGPADSVTG